MGRVAWTKSYLRSKVTKLRKSVHCFVEERGSFTVAIGVYRL